MTVHMAMPVTFHEVRSTAPPLACDDCGCLVGGSERERMAHQEWHDERTAIVVDLRAVKTMVA